jgi:hypothetical protein
MEELLDLIATNSPASDVSGKIKELIFNKASEKIDAIRPSVAFKLFGELGDQSETTGDEE